jgi:uncharacterized membrane-anchored protein YhcB (DUF1043 family)
MWYFIIGLLVGFICGFLVYRNNAKNLQASEAAAKTELLKVKSELTTLKVNQTSPSK